MAYLGRTPIIGRYVKIDDIGSSFNGSLTTFNLTSGGDAVVVQAETQIIVSLAGAIKEPITDYTVSGSQITFASAPANGVAFFATVLGDTHNVGVPLANTLENTHIKSDAAIAMSKLDGSSGSLSALTVTGDITLGDDLYLDSDSSVIHFGDDGDVTLTHNHNAGVKLAGAGGSTTSFNISNAVDTGGTTLGHSSNSDLGFIQVVEAGADFEIKVGGTATGNKRFTSTGDVGTTELLYGTDKGVVFNHDGAVDLYHNNAKKFETSASGVTVTSHLAFSGANPGILGSDTDGRLGLHSDASASAGSEILLYGSAHGSVPHVIRFRNNNSDSVTINATGKVGIGVTSPDAKLDVYQAAVGGTGYQNGIRVHAVSGIDSRWFEGGGSDMGIGTHSNHSFALRTNNSAKLIVAAGGDVGIGAASSYAKLQITGGAGSLPSETASGETILQVQNNAGATDTARMSIISGTSGQSNLDFGDSGDENMGSVYYSNATNLMGLRTNGSGVDLVINSAGKVGIGTTSFANGGSFEVVTGATGTIASFEGASADTLYAWNRAAGIVGFTTNAADTFEVKSNTTQFIDQSNASIATFTSATSTFAGDVAINGADLYVGNSSSLPSNSDIYMYGATDGTGHIFFNDGSNAGSIEYNHATNAMKFGVTSDTPVLTLLSDTNATFANWLGVGVNPPARTIHAKGGTDTRIRSEESSGTLMDMTVINTGHFLDSVGAVPFTINKHTGSQPLHFNTNNTNRMTVDSAGKVGIGTTSPQAPLHIAQTTGTLPGSSTNGVVIQKNAATTDIAVISLIGGAAADSRVEFGDAADRDIGMIRYTHSDNAMGFWTNTAQAMTIDSNGHVGIGMAPDSTFALKLQNPGGHTYHQIYGPTGYVAETQWYSQNASGSLIARMDNAGTGIFGTNVNTPLLFYTNNAERFRVTNAGNVGIGSSTANALLHLTSGTDQKLILSGSGSPNINLNSSTGDDFLVQNHAGAFRIYNLTDTRQDFSIAGDGNATFSGADTKFTWKNDNKVMMYYDASYHMGMHMEADTRDLVLYTKSGDNAGDIRFKTGTAPSERMAILADGTVGIGTTTVYANSILEIYGGAGNVIPTVTTTSDNHVAAWRSRRTAGSHQQEWYAGLRNGARHYDIFNNTDNSLAGRFTAGAQGSSNFTVYGAVFGQNGSGNAVYGIDGGTGQIWIGGGNANTQNINFQITSTAYAMRLDANSNLGIGTSSPQRRLHIAGGTATGLQITGNSTGAGSGDGMMISIRNDNNGVEFIQQENSHISFQTNGTERLHIAAAGNVGIGTAAPDSTLEVVGTAKFGEILDIERVGSPTQFIRIDQDQFLSTSPAITSFSAPGNSKVMRFTSTTDASHSASTAGTLGLDFYVQNSGKLNIRSGYTAFLNNNVGIGTTSPAQILHIVDEPQPRIRFSRGTSYYWDIGHLGSDFQFESQTGGVIMHMEHDGNVGIGTTSPDEKLEVWGNAKIGDTTSAYLTLGDDLSTGSAKLEIGTGRSGNGYSYIDLVGDTTYSDYGLRLIRFQTGANAPSTLEHRGTGTLTIKTTEAADIGFQTTNTNRVHIDSGGNFGIGTTSPGARLHVSDGSSGVTPFGDTAIFADNDGPVYMQLIGGTSDTLAYYFGDSGDADVGGIQYSNSANAMLFRTNGGEKVRIDSSGNVGIGTQSPAQKLDVAGYIKGDRAMIGKPSNFWSSTADYHGIAGLGGLASEGSYGVFLTSNGYRNSSTQWTSLAAASTTGAAQIGLYPQGYITLGTEATKSTGDSHFVDERVRITSAGNVGIGTTSPAHKLDVAPDTDTSARIGRTGISNVYADYMWLSHVDRMSAGNYALIQYNSGWTALNSAAGQSIAFRHDNTDQMTLTGGKLSIGTTSSSGTLHINASNNSRAIHSYTNQTTVDSTQYGVLFDHNTTFSGTAVPTGNRVSYGVYIDSDFSGTFNANTTSGQRFYNRPFFIHANSSHSTGTLYENEAMLLQSFAQATGSGKTDRLYGILNYTYDFESNGKTSQITANNGSFKRAEATGTTSYLYGASNYAYTYAGAGNTTNAYGASNHVAKYDTNTITTAMGSRNYITGDAGTISNGYGIVSQNYFTGTMTNSYGIYTTGFTKEHLAGNVGIGTTSPGQKLHVEGNATFRTAGGTGSRFDINLDNTTYAKIGNHYSSADVLSVGSLGSIEIVMDANGNSSGKFIDFAHNNDEGSGTSIMRITDGEQVGIGTTSPSSKLHVAGDIYATGNVSAYSSAIAKDNIVTIPNALELVNKLRGVSFDWKESGKKSMGMIYEEVKEVVPELTTSEKGSHGVTYQNTVAILIEAIKELKQEIDELKRNA